MIQNTARTTYHKARNIKINNKHVFRQSQVRELSRLVSGHSVCWRFGVSDFRGSNLHSAEGDHLSPFDLKYFPLPENYQAKGELIPLVKSPTILNQIPYHVKEKTCTNIHIQPTPFTRLIQSLLVAKWLPISTYLQLQYVGHHCCVLRQTLVVFLDYFLFGQTPGTLFTKRSDVLW